MLKPVDLLFTGIYLKNLLDTHFGKSGEFSIIVNLLCYFIFLIYSTLKSFTETHKNALLVNPKHGGHLGFFQHGFVTPDPLSWLATAAVQYTEAIVTLYVSNKLPHSKYQG